MTDKDKEAFSDCEKAMVNRGYHKLSHMHQCNFRDGWEAARNLDAPKLIFKEAIEKAGDAVEKLVSRGRYPGDSEFDYALEMAAAAFRAAGVRVQGGSMTPTQYWQECISDAVEHAGIAASPEQIVAIADSVQNAHENYGMAFYSPTAGEHLRSEIADLKRAVRREREKVHCEECNGHGSITTPGPYHSSTSQCWKCRGEGRHDP